MKVSLIVAVAENGVIGKDNDLIWVCPKTCVFSKKLHGALCDNGAQNFESFRTLSPLPNRTM